MVDQSTQHKLQVLHFIANDIQICIDIQYLIKILPLPLLEPLPNSPSYVVGLMNVAGKSIPVIDLLIRLGLPRTQAYTLDTPILLCKSGTQQIGMAVDKVLGLNSISTAELQITAELNVENSPFTATIMMEDKSVLLMDIPRVLAINLVHTDNEAILHYSSPNRI